MLRFCVVRGRFCRFCGRTQAARAHSVLWSDGGCLRPAPSFLEPEGYRKALTVLVSLASSPFQIPACPHWEGLSRGWQKAPLSSGTQGHPLGPRGLQHFSPARPLPPPALLAPTGGEVNPPALPSLPFAAFWRLAFAFRSLNLLSGCGEAACRGVLVTAVTVSRDVHPGDTKQYGLKQLTD